MSRILFLLALFLLTACGGDAVRIGLSLPTQREERWVRDKEKMEAEAKRLGLDLRVQVSDNSAARQVSQCENLIAQGVKVLILAPHDAASATVIVDKARAAGIKVISYDRLIMDAQVDLYLSFDNVKVGELQGAYITKLVPQGNYVVLSGAPTDNNARLFKEGAMQLIAPLVASGAIRIVMEQPVKDWQPSEAQKLMEQALTASADKVDAVLAPNDGTAGGCIQALAAKGLAGKVPITGQDAELAAAIRIVQGQQTMTVFKDTRLLAAKALEVALAYAKGQPVQASTTVNNNKMDVPSILLVPVVVDKANIDEVLIGSGYLEKGQVYR